jgi:hypothetical protein
MLIIELPEGGWVEATEIIGAVPHPPESEWADSPSGCVILLSSGHSIPTAETDEQIMQRKFELLVRSETLEGLDGEQSSI